MLRAKWGREDPRDKQGEEAADTFFLLALSHGLLHQTHAAALLLASLCLCCPMEQQRSLISEPQQPLVVLGKPS